MTDFNEITAEDLNQAIFEQSKLLVSKLFTQLIGIIQNILFRVKRRSSWRLFWAMFMNFSAISQNLDVKQRIETKLIARSIKKRSNLPAKWPNTFNKCILRFLLWLIVRLFRSTFTLTSQCFSFAAMRDHEAKVKNYQQNLELMETELKKFKILLSKANQKQDDAEKCVWYLKLSLSQLINGFISEKRQHILDTPLR